MMISKIYFYIMGEKSDLSKGYRTILDKILKELHVLSNKDSEPTFEDVITYAALVGYYVNKFKVSNKIVEMLFLKLEKDGYIKYETEIRKGSIITAEGIIFSVDGGYNEQYKRENFSYFTMIATFIIAALTFIALIVQICISYK